MSLNSVVFKDAVRLCIRLIEEMAVVAPAMVGKFENNNNNSFVSLWAIILIEIGT